ncbi:MAG TPA: hypothetical protein VIK18_14680 [Pirellulales bacterium]
MPESSALWSRFPLPLRVVLLAALCCCGPAAQAADDEFPPELTELTPYEHNPVFMAEAAGSWDAKIRERGWILHEGDTYYLWYTGYDGSREGIRRLGLATSPDGIRWKRAGTGPLDATHWIEDMMVVKSGATYYMAAEGVDDIAQLLTSQDRVHWTRQGSLDVRLTSRQPISAGPRGTPTLWKQGDTWYLFYERGDLGVWLATSADARVWTNVSDAPVLGLGSQPHDRYMVAMNQVIRHAGRYYALYHSKGGRLQPWVSNLAMSTDLVHWKKYPRNPLLADNQSSAIYVYDGDRYRLYVMHDQVRLYFSRQKSTP